MITKGTGGLPLADYALHLLKRTRTGYARWISTDKEGQYLTVDEQSSVVLDHEVRADGSSRYRLAVLNNRGTPIDHLESEWSSAGDESSSLPALSSDLLKALYQAAQSVAGEPSDFSGSASRYPTSGRDSPGWRSPWAQAALIGSVVILVLGSFALLWIAKAGSENYDVASTTAAILGMASAVAAILSSLQYRFSRASQSSDAEERLRVMADSLASAVREQWTREAAMRRLRQPLPLRIRFIPSARSHPRGNDPEVATSKPAAEHRLRAEAQNIVEIFNLLPKQKLVVLGEPGAGKTTLAVLLVLGLIEQRQPGEPVPVLLNAALWDPERITLRDWIAVRLSEDYPQLRTGVGTNPDDASVLVSRRLIVPVVDGIDELPLTLREAALTAIDGDDYDGPLVATCRSAEYREYRSVRGGILSEAAVVDIEPVSPTDAAAYLRFTSMRERGWEQLEKELLSKPHGPLARTLSTPLMVTIARAVFADDAADPSALLDRIQLTDRRAIESYLFDRYIGAVYQEPKSSRASGSYDPQKASRWLGLLARQLNITKSQDLAWWRLTLEPPTSLIMPAVRSIWQLVFSAGVAMLAHVASELPSFVAILLGTTLFIGLQFGATGTGASYPRRFGFRRPALHNAAAVVRSLLGALAGGLAVGLAGSSTLDLTLRILCGASTGLILFGVNFFTVPSDQAQAASPRKLLKEDGSVALARAIASFVIYGLPIYLLSVGFLEREEAIATAGSLGVVSALIVISSSTAWGRFALTRANLASRGKAPWRLLTFLEDAYRRGVLRQSGAVYQFRHSQLQDHLAQADASFKDERAAAH